MSVTQIYLLAHAAQNKLSIEASRPDSHLRLIIGHANFLDSLMIQLTEAEQVQCFNDSVRGLQAAEEYTHPRWTDAVVEETASFCVYVTKEQGSQGLSIVFNSAKVSFWLDISF